MIPVPLVYAFLLGKQQERYEEVLQFVKDAVGRYRIAPCAPQKIMTDFELGIINACTKIFPTVPVSCCYFHLGQSIYRRIQGAGLQQQYNDPDDRTLKDYAHRLLALAFVPMPDVPAAFNALYRECPPELHGIYDNFNEYHIAGKPRCCGRQRATRPGYVPTLWNQY